MKRQLIILLVLFGVFMAIGCAGNNTGQPPAAPAETPVVETITPVQTPSLPVSNVTSQPTGEGKTVDVSIKDFAFEPASLTVSAGDTVRWTNLDTATHTVKGPGFESQALREGDSYEYIFTKAGNYVYECSIHPSMQGNIMVK